jgi:hypothetical protein
MGVQQQPGHCQQPVRPGRVQVMPARGADRVERRPARPRVGPRRNPGVALDLLADAVGVAEQYRGGEAVARDLRRGGEHSGRAAGPVADAGLQEYPYLLVEVRGVCVLPQP